MATSLSSVAGNLSLQNPPRQIVGVILCEKNQIMFDWHFINDVCQNNPKTLAQENKSAAQNNVNLVKSACTLSHKIRISPEEKKSSFDKMFPQTTSNSDSMLKQLDGLGSVTS